MIASALRRLTFTLIGVGLALVLAEGVLQLMPRAPWRDRLEIGYPWLEYDPTLGWVNRPGFRQQEFGINALGFRGQEAEARKRPEVLRIVCLGDSRTFGIRRDFNGFQYDNDYPEMLGAMLSNAAGATPAEVVNAGVIGYTSAQGLRQLVLQILSLHPDIVVVAFGFNDHSPAWKPALASHEPKNSLARAAFYTLAPLRVFQLGESVYQAISAVSAAPFSVPWVDEQEYAYNLRRLAEVAREHGIPILLLSQGLRSLELGDSLPSAGDALQPRDEYGLLGVKTLAELHQVDERYRAILARVSRELRLPVADAVAAFAAHRDEPLFSRYDLVHPNPAGARLIAETLLHRMQELGWLTLPEGHAGARPNAASGSNWSADGRDRREVLDRPRNDVQGSKVP